LCEFKKVISSSEYIESNVISSEMEGFVWFAVLSEDYPGETV